MGFPWEELIEEGILDTAGNLADAAWGGAADLADLVGAPTLVSNLLDFQGEQQNLINHTLGNFAGPLTDSVGGLVESAGNFLDAGATGLLNLQEDGSADWGNLFGEAWNDTGDVWSDVGESFSQGWDETVGDWNTFLDDVNEFTPGFRDGANALSDSVGDVFGNAIGNASGAFGGDSGGGGIFGGGGGGGGPVEQGMNRAQAQAALERIRADREDLVRIVADSRQTVDSLTEAWKGSDSRHYKEDFTSVAQQMDACAEAIEAMARALQEQIQQQQSTSSL